MGLGCDNIGWRGNDSLKEQDIQGGAGSIEWRGELIGPEFIKFELLAIKEIFEQWCEIMLLKSIYKTEIYLGTDVREIRQFFQR